MTEQDWSDIETRLLRAYQLFKEGVAGNQVAPALQRSRHKKAPDDAGAFETLKISRDQYFATTGPVQLKR
jgi:hypothetical protein